ncbi:MAG: TIR domain-containing protein [Symploca sp. SIO2E9]|nr:TIR domain-containing protein [Symploca sp. SIO2E9]
MKNLFDAFISYGRADSKAFATKLHQRLTELGLKVWFDQNDIPLAVDFQDQIDDGIQKTDNFLFIIAPHSINSSYCHKEIELALKHNKRIIPLLHVEEISRETWQQRNPDHTEADWQAYQAQGRHSSFPNMHPEISKINWVYFREGIDDFPQSLAGLLETFKRHQDYVHQHTSFLNQALEWERHQQQRRYLLIGEERIEAQAWLKRKFKDEQPPCQPTDLHCEFICESIKNANNLMSEVFLSYAEKDKVLMEKIRHLLMRESLTVWTNNTDIETGEAFEESIKRGIEETDNLIYLISSDALQSVYCQLEIDYAFSLNKRIIPLLVRETPLEEIPWELRSLQFINFTDNQTQADYSDDTDKLIKVLRQDAAYYQEHKILLSKALKWERQHHNPSILLRGYNLRYAQAWLKVAKKRTQHLPIPLQEEFITQSLLQPPGVSLDVFVSYSRADSDFARQLNDALQIQGKRTWFDQESIASGTDFQQEIYRGIESSDNFLFVISPSSISSPYCSGEVEYAQKLNKRIITILHRPVQIKELHPGLASVQWIDFNQYEGDFYANFKELIRTLDTDLDHLRSHTRLLLRAIEWEQQEHDNSFLLRERDLEASERWLQQGVNKDPRPTELQSQYISASQKLRQKVQALEESYQQAEEDLKRAVIYHQPKLLNVFVISMVVTILVGIIRFLGILQPLELEAYDQLMRRRPSEKPDDRFLIVEVTEDDIQAQANRQGKSLSDSSLNRLLEKLEQYQPRLIGLDLYRDFEVEKNQPNLAARLRQNDRLFALCKRDELNEQGKVIGRGVPPPPEVSLKRIGFSDVVKDEDGVVRRQLLVQAKDDGSECTSPYAFSLLLAKRYLEIELGENFQYQEPNKFTDDNFLIGNTAFKGLEMLQDNLLLKGGYQFMYANGGYQVLLNYRSYQEDDARDIFKRVSLEEILNNPNQAELVKNRIVLIGVTAPSANDYWSIPYGTGDLEMSGVVLQAQMVSHILSAVLDGRQLLWTWSQTGELFWIWSWALLGGLIAWKFQRRLDLGLVTVIAIAGVPIICFVFLTQTAGWVPLIPSVLALVVTRGSLFYFAFRSKNQPPVVI